MMAELSPAAAIAGSRWILHGLPCSCRNCVGSAFWNIFQTSVVPFLFRGNIVNLRLIEPDRCTFQVNTISYLLVYNCSWRARNTYDFFIKIFASLRPASIVDNQTANHSLLFPCFVPHFSFLQNENLGIKYQHIFIWTFII